jgi:RNA polymerase sigma-70 factor (ECF subfamily)
MTSVAAKDGLLHELLSFREDVFRVCLGMARNVADAEDLCQEVFLKALSRRGDIRLPEARRVWLLRIARTTCLDYHRRRRLVPMVPLEYAPENSAADRRTPDSAVESRDILRRLKEVIRRLPRKHREVFILREYGGLSYEDLSRTLGIRRGTVMSRLSRARQAVASAMEVTHHE